MSKNCELGELDQYLFGQGNHYEIYKKLGRTVTTIKGKGLISGDKEVLYCVLTRIEVFELKHIAERMDNSAFITILEVSDIIGNHIKSNNKPRKKRRNK